MTEKKVPNPYGKKGGEKHQQKVKEIFADVEKRGFIGGCEKFIRLITGQGRYIDVVGLDQDAEIPVEFHQIGIQTKKGLPVKRERDVIEEVENDKNIQVEFHAYNVEEDKDNDGSSD
jgi:hypothetical protein